MTAIIIKNYEHVNRSFKNWNTPKGRYIKNKDEYDRAMKEEGMITCEEAESRVKKPKDYKLSSNAEEIIREAKMKSKKGKINLKMSDPLLVTMIDQGIVKQKGYGIEHLPEHLRRGL